MGIYDDLGIKTLINGYATLTRLGGSLMPPEVLDAMAEAARSFVDIDELQLKVGRRIAEWTHNEAAYITSGAAAGLALATAACIAGTDPILRERLPFSDGMKNEVVVHSKGKVHYDFAVRQAGGKLVEIGTQCGASEEDFTNSLGDRTAAVLYFYNPSLMAGQVTVERAAELVKDGNIPLIVDAAAQIPPVENLWRFTEMGADLVLFSGGKGLCGPQSSGLMLGRADLINAAVFNACPRPFIGRPMKAGKEEIVGLMAAVRRYLDLDHDELMASYEDQVQRVVTAFSDCPNVDARRSFPSEAGQPMPRAEIILDGQSLGTRRDDILEELLSGEPGISLAPSGANGIYINPQTLRPGDIEIIIPRLAEILRPLISR
jgi:D-glucosaminate-6-phosphate ammonia-lyase